MITLIASVLLFSACKKDDPITAQEILDMALARVDQAQLAADIATIDDTLAARGLTGEILTEPNGVRYKADVMGSGPMPTLENFILINYSGKLLSDGSTFDSGQNVSFPLANLILGWQTTLPLVPEGSTVTLYIPSGLAYGPSDLTDNTGSVVIPANSILVFEIELLDVL